MAPDDIAPPAAPAEAEKPRLLPLSRRAFFVGAGVVGCAVAFGAYVATRKQELKPNIWVTLHDDGMIDVIAPGIELGQGASTALPRFVAEEMDADWDHVRAIAAPADEKQYGNPLFWGIQITAGSRTALGYFDVLRIAGAQTRFILMTAAAARWNAPIAELTTSRSTVVHAASNRSIAYRDLIGGAKVPASFPPFYAPGEVQQPIDDFFGEAPPSELLEGPNKANGVRLKARAEYQLVGKDAPRRDIPDKTTGKTNYGIDNSVPGMIYATVISAPVRDDEPATIDDAAAKAVPGVTDVMPLPYGVAVIGDNTASVLHAATLLNVEWRPGPRRGKYDNSKVMDDFAAISRQPGAAAVRMWEKGDAGRADAAVSRGGVLAFEGRSELIYHAPIEPQNAIVRIAPGGTSAEVWVGTQWPMTEKQAVGGVLGISPDAVTVHMVNPGGSYGRRQEPGAAIDAAHLAKATGKPVKVIWSRTEDLKRNPFRQAMVCRAEAAIGAGGRITALRHRVVADSWFARMFPDFYAQYNQTDPGNWVGAMSTYDVPLQAVDNVTARRDVDVCYMRGIGVAQTKFAQETLIDIAANRAHADPVAYRTAMLSHEPRGLAVVESVATDSDWVNRRAAATSTRAVGFAYVYYASAYSAVVADVSLDRASGELRVHEVWCAIDVGFAAQPDIIASQMEGGLLQGMSIALYEQVTLRDGVIQQTSFTDYPILRMSNTPAMHVKVLSTDTPMAGVGEIGVTQMAPAINSALIRMTGKPAGTLPMTPAQVRGLLGA